MIIVLEGWVRRGIRRAWIIVLVLSCPGMYLAGCSSLVQTLAARLTPSPSPIQSAATPGAGFTPALTGTPTENIDCAFVWSSRTLTNVSVDVVQAFRSAGYDEVEVEASAYGRDCLDPRSNRVVHFTPLQTDFYINVATANIHDPQELGEWVEKILRVLKAFPPGTVPGPNPGNIGISFINSPDSTDLWFTRSRGESLVKEGLKGGDLYNALQGAQ